MSNKVYVDVLAEFSKDGLLIPKEITWEDGRKYEINNKSRREYEKRMGMITDEERLRVKEFIEQLEAQRKKPQ